MINLLIYAPPGHGKTTFLGTAAGDDRISPMLLLDFEAGIDSILSKCHVLQSTDALQDRIPSVKKIDVLHIKHWKDFAAVIEFLKAFPERYKSVALDSLSEMNYLNLDEIVKQASIRSPRHDHDVAEMQDYLRSSFQMRRLVRLFRDLPINSFWTAGVQETTDPLTKLPAYVPALTGKLAREIPGLVLIVGYLALMEDENGETHRTLITQPLKRFIAKDRSEGGKLGAFVQDPTLPLIFDKLEIEHQKIVKKQPIKEG